jgi:uncharacterized cupredoxin-like copper-binding protein
MSLLLRRSGWWLIGAAVGLVAILFLVRPTGATATASDTSHTNAATVTAVIKDRSIRLSISRVTAGPVTFIVRNAGTMKHEFVVIKTNRAPNALPMKGSQASEAGAKGEIEEIVPGATRRLTLTLPAGKYVVICNLPGHYKRGQFAGLVAEGAGTGGGTPQTTQVNVSMFEMGFKLSRTKVPFGTVVFNLKNDGKLPHDFSFGSKGGGSPLLQPGQTAKFTVAFPKPGTFTARSSNYTFICTVEGHQESGMIGVLTVTADS